LTILPDTFSLLEIFLFAPKPEGFVIFHDHLKIPNINMLVSPQHHLILIKNPHFSSPLIQEALALHFPTRRPALDSLVTLLGLATEPTATVVVIEQKHWPMEWVYMVRLEEKGQPPQLIWATLDRGEPYSHDTSIRIRPKALELTNGGMAFFFNRFERLIQVTIIQQENPSFHLTIRNNPRPAPAEDTLI